MNKKKILTAAITAVAALIALAGCITKEEKQKLRETESLAEQYLEDKYGEDFKLSDSGYIIVDSLFPEVTSNMHFEFTDGTVVYYDAEDDGSYTFYDNKQSEEINKAIVDEIVTPLFEEMGDVRIGLSDMSINSAFIFGVRYEENSLYHEYYDGDIKSYLKKEEVSMSSQEKIYLVCGADEWEADFETYKIRRVQYLGSGYTKLIAVTEEGYQNEVSGYYEKGAFAELRWYSDTNMDLYVQKYVEVADNIYICANDDDGFVLEESDIVFEPVEGFGEFADKKAYKAVFSDRIKAKCDSESRSYCYVKLESDKGETVLYQYIPEKEKSYSVCDKLDREGIREDYIYWLA